MNFINIKKRKEDGIYAVFLGGVYCGNLVLIGGGEVEIGEKIQEALEENDLTEMDLINVLREEESYEDFYGDPHIVEELRTSGTSDDLEYGGYEDEDLDGIDRDNLATEGRVSKSIYEDIKISKDVDGIYGTSGVVYFKEEGRRSERVLRDGTELLNLEEENVHYHKGGKYYEVIRKENKRLVSYKEDLFGRIKETLKRDLKLRGDVREDLREELSELDEEVDYWRGYYSEFSEFRKYNDDRDLYYGHSKQVESLENIIRLLDKKLELIKERNPLEYLISEFS